MSAILHSQSSASRYMTNSNNVIEIDSLAQLRMAADEDVNYVDIA